MNVLMMLCCWGHLIAVVNKYVGKMPFNNPVSFKMSVSTSCDSEWWRRQRLCACITPRPSILGISRSTQLINLQHLVRISQGIPYAAPPLGDLRWQPPVPHPGWNGTLDGSQSPMMCTQVSLNSLLLSIYLVCSFVYVRFYIRRSQDSIIVKIIRFSVFLKSIILIAIPC